MTTGPSGTRRSDIVTESAVCDDWAASIGVDTATDTVAYAVSGISAAAFISLVIIRRLCCITAVSAVSATAAPGEIIAYGTIADDWAAAVKTGNSTAITVSVAGTAVSTPLAIVIVRYRCIRIDLSGKTGVIVFEGPVLPRAILPNRTVAALGAGNGTIGYHTVSYGGRTSGLAKDCAAVTIARGTRSIKGAWR